MDFTFIIAAVQMEWNLWNVRGFMIFSICMQLILALAAPLRQKTSNCFIKFIVWSSYLLADWVPIFVFGLIFNCGCWNLESNKAVVPPDVMVFWAAFLLVHLGSPDTITAFSLEDNALWHRHLAGLIAKVFVFMYFLVKTLPNNRLLVPTTLIFVAGVIKYGERTRALHLASLENLKKTTKRTAVWERREGNNIFYQILKGLIVDVSPSLHDSYKSHETIRGISPPNVFPMILEELNLLYELLYTKIKATSSIWGNIVRGIAYYSTLAAFIFFCLADKHELRGVDLAISYALFAGDFILHVGNIALLFTSESNKFTLKDIIWLALVQGILPPLIGYALCFVTKIVAKKLSAIGDLVKRRWSEELGSFNILYQCFKQCALRKGQKPGKGKLDMIMRHTIFNDIKGNIEVTYDAARMREVYEARGDRALRRNSCGQLMPYIMDFPYENTLLIWHVATEIYYHTFQGFPNSYRTYSKELSDYMMYLLIKQPKLMSTVAGISHVRYKDTCTDLKLLRRRSGAPTMREFCASTRNEYANVAINGNNHSCSVLKDSCRLVERLIRENIRWEVIYKVWVEMLSYAACHCRADSHVRLLSEGSEFITAVWLFMALSGVTNEFPAT